MTARPFLWWLERGQSPAWTLDALGGNLVDLQSHLAEALDADERARTEAAIDWHVSALAGWAFGEYLTRSGRRDLPHLPVARPVSSAVWVDAPDGGGDGQP
jgi:hypothetical protein